MTQNLHEARVHAPKSIQKHMIGICYTRTIFIDIQQEAKLIHRVAHSSSNACEQNITNQKIRVSLP